MKTVYIASAYSHGDVVNNVRQSLEVADQLLAAGYAPYAPLLSHFWDLISPKDYEDWLKLDMEWLKRCDCVLRIPGISVGADEEVALARDLDIPVFFSVTQLVRCMEET